ncbi:MAG: (2Fe-2S)-binding protein [Gammaproteobacteria bacterium]|nr:(2Fe-2S)-binding protein [Gammaproteobacteria bacterium]
MADQENSDNKTADTTPNPLNPRQRSRRDFLQDASTAAVVGTAVPVLGIRSATAQQPDTIPAAKTTIQLSVNGSNHTVDVEDRWTLAELLRDHLQLTGTKIGCDRSECGACTVLMNGVPVYSCSQLAVWAEGAEVTTVEGLMSKGELSPLQQAFVDNNGPQCGFCTPGQLMTATALLNRNSAPSAQQVKTAMVGNLCRCSNYNAIVEAVVSVAGKSGGVA